MTTKPVHSMTTKRHFIFRDNYFCEKYKLVDKTVSEQLLQQTSVKTRHTITSFYREMRAL